MQARFNVTVNPRIRTLRDALKLDPRDMQEMLVPVDDRFTRNEKRLFSSEGSSGGRRWTPLSERYRRRKSKTHPGRKILSRSGRMRKAFTNKGDPDHVATFTLRPRAKLQVGALSRVASFHANGGGFLPKRDPIQHTDRQMRQYTRLIADYLIGVKLDRVKRALLAGSIGLGRRGARRG